jgi:arylsulfatase A-like enzyme
MPARCAGALLGLLLLVACGGAPAESGAPVAIRLVDLFAPDAVQGRVAPPPPPPRTEWRFDAAPPAFEAGPGVVELALRGGRLAGRTAAERPVLRIEVPGEPRPGDFVHSVELRMRVSTGASVALDFQGPDGKLAEALAKPRDLWSLQGPVVPGEALRTYTLPVATTVVPSERVKQIYLSPTDASGASFEIESIRVVFETEFLAGIPSGVGWRGLSEIYREALVARAPESIRFSLTAPPRAWLDLAIGTVEAQPIRFRVAVREGSREAVVLERTLTHARRWEPARVDLAGFAGRPIELSLSLDAEQRGALGFWGSPVVRRSGAGDAPNVILIQADTLRQDHLGLYGYRRETAPVLARVAAEGALFQDCISQATWTKVSSPSIQLSLYPSSHGIANFADRLPASAHTLAEVFRDAGRATLALSSIFFTGKLTNLQQGYEELHESTSLAVLSSSKTAGPLVDRLLPWLDTHRDVPFFVFLHVFDPHDPYEPQRPYDALFADPGGKPRHEREAKEVRKFITNPLRRAFGMPSRTELAAGGFDPDAYVAYDRDWYDGAIRAMDAELGRVFERLRELGLAERTLVAFTSDHGEEFLEHGAMFHGQSVYGELTRVPLVLWGPGRVPAGAVVEETVESVDIMPTLLELAGVAPPPGVQGRSLVPLLAASRGGTAPTSGWTARPAVTEKRPESDPNSPTRGDRVSTALVLDGWKLIQNSERSSGIPEYELYDVRRDPLDQHDLAAREPDRVQRLRGELEAWRAKVAEIHLEPEASAPESLSAEELERLKSLGYVQ